MTARRLANIEAGKESAFLYGVALRVASDFHRKRKVTSNWVELDEVDLAHEGISPEEALEQRRTRQLLDYVLQKMPLELRSVLVLFELEGLPIKEIAEIEGVPIGTASSRLRRARDEFSAITKRVRATLFHTGVNS